MKTEFLEVALRDSADGQKKCAKLLKQIKAEITLGSFNYSARFPNGSKIHVFGERKTKRELTLDLYFAEWVSEKLIKDSTRTMWESAYRCHVGSTLGNRFLRDISASDCRKVVKGMADKNLCGGSINKVVKLMKMFFKTAHQDSLIENDPAETLKRAKEFKTEVRPFTFEEVHLILKTCKYKYPHLLPFLCTFTFTGMRPNELYALKWGRIDLDERIITITEGRVLGRDTLPKTVGSQRHVNIIFALETILREHAKSVHVLEDYVFKNTKGTPLCEQVVRRMWHKILDEAGIEKRRLYELRHTFATQAIALGENPSWVSAMLGHSDAQITFRKYNRYVKNLTRQDGSVLQQKYEELGNL